MADHVVFTGFLPVATPSKFAFVERFALARQNRKPRKTCPRYLHSSARFRPVMVTSPLDQDHSTRNTVPDAVRDANTIIVGGGPTGLLSAILMAQRNIPVTVVEQDDDLGRFDPLKAYALAINTRGMKALGMLPSLLQEVKALGVPYRSQRQINIDADGRSLELGVMRFPGTGIRTFHTRLSIVETFQSYSKNFANITFLKRTRVTNVSYDKSGEMELSLCSDKKKYSVRTKLILACDGKNSIVSETLTKSADENKSLFRSLHGLGKDSLPTPTTGKLVKSIPVSADYVTNYSNESDVSEEIVVIHRLLPKGGTPPAKSFWITFFPMHPEMISCCGGRIGSFVQPKKSELWSLKTVEEGYKLFDEVLPQLQARTHISFENMKKFVESKPLRFPNSTRLESLAVHVGADPSGGVLFLGDAAHSFPPDRGQGLNSAFEDVEVFMNVLGQFSSDSTVEDVLREYETERGKDVRGLLKYIRRSTGFVAQRSSFEVGIQIADTRLRTILSRRFPKFFSPSLLELVSRDLPFSEVIRLYDATTVRMMICSILVLLPFIGVFMSGSFH
ncbi:unnamed protein product [Agarophyton chilense]|eukprot:gb/GEZJ01004199.1/.p1 GENE.gb/GEZJ01004199.1/~~gb/GEZJ01004199.1/.p1  ORF type:complete len:561 (+),score=65.74 gb/GEZJ01004199.1/:796-2478(+)